MKKRNIVRIVVAGVLAVALLAAAMLAGKASKVPDNYSPLALDDDEKRPAAKHFFGLIQLFNNQAQQLDPFHVSLPQDMANMYLAAADEIVALYPGQSPGRVENVLLKAGISQPAVVFDDGTVTLMFASPRLGGRIVSLVLGLAVDDSGLRVSLDDVRVGELSVPRWLVGDALSELRVDADGSGAADGSEDSAFAAAAAGIAAVPAAAGRDPLPTEFDWVGGKRVRITGIEIDNGMLRLRGQRVK